MYNIKCLNKISSIGTKRFNDKYSVAEDMENPHGILVRSASMHDMEMPENLLAIARAGAGVNNIPLDKCSESGVVVFNTPGANANAVKELVLAGLLLSSRKITESMDWAKTLKGKGADVPKLVEKGKGDFAGPELTGKTLGVVGLGAIGILVANCAKNLGMNVLGFDPYLSVDAAWGLSRYVKKAKDLDEIYATCDYITVHVPLTPDTKEMINDVSIAKMKDGVRLLNFSRGELANNGDIIKNIENGKISSYVVDFPNDEVLNVKGVLAIPHLGASTPESEDNCAMMAVDEMREYLENGNIINSVNMPNISLGRSMNCKRILLIHKNVPNTIGSFTAVCGDCGMNIENMLSKSRGDYACTILDVSGTVQDCDINKLSEQEHIIKVRVID